MTYPQTAPPTNALALAGLILGIAAAAIGALVTNVYIAAFLFFLPGALAITFGFVGINTANRMDGLRRKHASWAVVLGFSPMVAWVAGRWLSAALFNI